MVQILSHPIHPWGAKPTSHGYSGDLATARQGGTTAGFAKKRPPTKMADIGETDLRLP